MATGLVRFDDLVRAPGKLGYEVARQSGSHVRLRCPGRQPVTVPRAREIPRGTLRAILKTVEVSEEELERLLE